MSKLLQINVCLNLSTGNIAQSIGDAALNRGWESYIAFSSREPMVPSRSKIIKVGRFYDPYLHYIESKVFDREGLASRCATKQLIKHIVNIKPDVIQLHNIHDHWLNYKILFEYLNTTNIKVVWTFHDCWPFTGHCFHFVTKSCELWKTGCYMCPLHHVYPNTLFDRSTKNYRLKRNLFSNSRNLSVVPCSDWMSDFVRESFFKNKRIHTIKNGIDISVYKPSMRRNMIEGQKFKILAVSNVWNKEKGLDDIYILRKLLPHDYVITIVGLTVAQQKNLPKGINGIQRTQSKEELVELYSDSDVLINPTYADTFPTINLEALACGTPVITYKTGGSPEAIDENTGAVVEQGDIIALCEKIKEFHSICFKQNHTDECRKRAVEKFDKNICFENYINLYEDLLGENVSRK